MATSAKKRLGVTLWAQVFTFLNVKEHERARSTNREFKLAGDHQLSWPPVLELMDGLYPETMWQRVSKSHPKEIALHGDPPLCFLFGPASRTARVLRVDGSVPHCLSSFIQTEIFHFKDRHSDFADVPPNTKTFIHEAPSLTERWRTTERKESDHPSLTRIVLRGYDPDNDLHLSSVPAFPNLRQLDIELLDTRWVRIWVSDIDKFPNLTALNVGHGCYLLSKAAALLKQLRAIKTYGIRMKDQGALWEQRGVTSRVLPLCESLEFYCATAHDDWIVPRYYSIGEFIRFCPSLRCLYLPKCFLPSLAEAAPNSILIHCSTSKEVVERYEKHALRGEEVPPRDGKVRIYVR